jgi:hypothetical protein
MEELVFQIQASFKRLREEASWWKLKTLRIDPEPDNPQGFLEDG